MARPTLIYCCTVYGIRHQGLRELRLRVLVDRNDAQTILTVLGCLTDWKERRARWYVARLRGLHGTLAQVGEAARCMPRCVADSRDDVHVLGLELTLLVVADWNRSAVSPTTEERAGIATAIASSAIGSRFPRSARSSCSLARPRASFRSSGTQWCVARRRRRVGPAPRLRGPTKLVFALVVC